MMLPVPYQTSHLVGDAKKIYYQDYSTQVIVVRKTSMMLPIAYQPSYQAEKTGHYYQDFDIKIVSL